MKARHAEDDDEMDAQWGNEHALGRGLVTIPAKCGHAITVEGPLKAKTLVLYTTRRPPRTVHRLELLELGFPPQMPQSPARLPHAQEDQPHGQCNIGVFTVDVKRVDLHGQPAVRAPVLHVTIAEEAVVSDLREALRRRLKYNPNKLVLFQWPTVTVLQEDAEVWPLREQIALAVRYNREGMAAHQPPEQQIEQDGQHVSVELTAPGREVQPPTQQQPSLERAMQLAQQAQEAAEQLNTCVRRLNQEIRDLQQDGQGELVTGAGRQTRVIKDKLVDAAASSMIRALPLTRQGLVVEHLLVRHIMAADPKATRAVFQATTVAQRYRAFSAGLKRAGLTAMAAGIASAAGELDQSMKVAPTEPEVEGRDLHPTTAAQLPQVRSEDEQVAMLRLMVQQIQQDVAQMQQTSRNEIKEKELLQRQMSELEGKRVTALEKWAHEVDSTGAESPQADRNSTTVEVHQRLCALEELVKALGQQQEEDVEQRRQEVSIPEHVATQDPYQCEAPARKRGRPATLKSGADAANKTSEANFNGTSIVSQLRELQARMRMMEQRPAARSEHQSGSNQHDLETAVCEMQTGFARHEADLQGLKRRVGVKGSRMGVGSNTLASAAQASEGAHGQAADVKWETESDLKVEVAKLWSLYHRLQHHMDMRGVIPEVSVIFPGDKRRQEDEVNLHEVNAEINQACANHMQEEVAKLASRVQAIERIVNVVWPWLTAVAAKVQEVVPMTTQMSMHIRAMEMQVAQLGAGVGGPNLGQIPMQMMTGMYGPSQMYGTLVPQPPVRRGGASL
eukprot:6160904-Amphidinium_carterae.2